MFKPCRKETLHEFRGNPHQQFADPLVRKHRPVRGKGLPRPFFNPAERLSLADQVIGTCQYGIPVIWKDLFQYMADTGICTDFIQKGRHAAAVGKAFRLFFFRLCHGSFFIAATQPVWLHCSGFWVEMPYAPTSISG